MSMHRETSLGSVPILGAGAGLEGGVTSVQTTGRYEETAYHRHELEAVKRENEALKRRIRELERTLRARKRVMLVGQGVRVLVLLRVLG